MVQGALVGLVLGDESQGNEVANTVIAAFKVTAALDNNRIPGWLRVIEGVAT